MFHGIATFSTQKIQTQTFADAIRAFRGLLRHAQGCVKQPQTPHSFEDQNLYFKALSDYFSSVPYPIRQRGTPRNPAEEPWLNSSATVVQVMLTTEAATAVTGMKRSAEIFLLYCHRVQLLLRDPRVRCHAPKLSRLARPQFSGAVSQTRSSR